MKKTTTKSQALTTRLLKAYCPSCFKGNVDYIVRLSRKTIAVGMPICPVHNRPLKIEE